MFWFISLIAFSAIGRAASSDDVFRIEDVFIPDNCESVAKPSDHLLIEYEIQFHNGSIGSNTKKPQQLYHIQLDLNDSPIVKALKGMCKNATRKVVWDFAGDINLFPMSRTQGALAQLDEPIGVELTVEEITDQEDFQIFAAIKENNASLILDLIEAHKGINAVDEYGFTPLMIAAANQHLPLLAGLLNTRRPAVEVNKAKASGFTALFYAVEKGSPTIVQALLRRGADPNMSAQQPDSKGNTPLHYACLMEKTKHTEMLLEYGANPYLRNVHGQTPLQLLPVDAVMSTKLYYKKMFEVS